jgi:hypothetical protein
MGHRVIEVLYFAGCPNWQDAVEIVQRVANETGLDVEIRLVRVESAEEAERQRFLGSPTIRIDGGDVEDGADMRTDYALGCRVYSIDGKLAGLPPISWITRALSSSSSRRA